MNLYKHTDNIEIEVGAEKVKAIEMNYEGSFDGNFQGNGIVGMNYKKIIIAFLSPPKDGVLFDFEGEIKLKNIYYYIDDKKKLLAGYGQIKEDKWQRNFKKLEDITDKWEELDTEKKYTNTRGISNMSYELNGVTHNISPKDVKKNSFTSKKRKQQIIRKKHLKGLSSYEHNHSHIYYIDRYGNGYTSNNSGHIHEIIKYVIQDANNHTHEIEAKENGIK